MEQGFLHDTSTSEVIWREEGEEGAGKVKNTYIYYDTRKYKYKLRGPLLLKWGEMPAIFFALISYLGWGIGDVFGTAATRKIGGYSTTFWSSVFSLLILSLYTPLALGDLKNITPGILLIVIVLSIIGSVGLISFYEGLRIGNASLVGTIAASFAALTVVLSIIFLGDRVTQSQSVSILIIFLGLLLSSLDLKEARKRGKIANKEILLALVAMVAWGVYFTFIKVPIREIGWFWPGYLSFLTFPLLFLFMRIRRIKLNKPNLQGAFLPLLASTTLLAVAALSFNIGISRGLTAIVAPIAGSYPTLFAFLAFLVFKDPITKQQILGIITTLLGIVLLSFLSV